MSMVMVLYVVKARSSFYIVLYEDVIVSEESSRGRGRPKKTALAAVKERKQGCSWPTKRRRSDHK